MKKAALIFTFFISVSCFSGETDSLSWYKEKAKRYEMQPEPDSSINTLKKELQYEFEKREAILKTEMDEKEKFYKARIDKLQTLLIASCGSSVLVIIAAFYMLNKKKAQDKKQ